MAESIGHEWLVEGPIVAQGGIILCISIFLTWIREGKTSISILVVPISEPRIFQIQHFHSECAYKRPDLTSVEQEKRRWPAIQPLHRGEEDEANTIHCPREGQAGKGLKKILNIKIIH